MFYKYIIDYITDIIHYTLYNEPATTVVSLPVKSLSITWGNKNMSLWIVLACPNNFGVALLETAGMKDSLLVPCICRSMRIILKYSG